MRAGQTLSVTRPCNHKSSLVHSYFIERGIASIVAGNSHKRLEVGLIGPEGMTGLPIVLGNDRSPHENYIQVAGVGSRIPADKLREAMQQSRSLEKLEERLARWLLMANDRLDSNEIPLTHEFLSLMLGVRRAGVTIALHYLEQRGVIQLSRGQIVILDRDGLKASANGTYHQPEALRIEKVQSWAGRASVPGREADPPG